MEKRFELFTTYIAKINRSIRRIKTEEMAEFDLKSPHVSCIYYLYKQNLLTAKQLCDICEEDKAAISRSIDYLEKNGLIKCSSKTEKRYKSPLSLTEKGQEIGNQVARVIDEVVDKASIGLTEQDREVFYKCLFVIANNLQKIEDEYGD